MIRLVANGLWASNRLLEAQYGSSDNGVSGSEIVFAEMGEWFSECSESPWRLG